MSYKPHFERFLARGDVLHFAAHSHHLWPDVSFDAHQRAWTDAARLADEKWGPIIGELLPRTCERVARILGLSAPSRIAFAPNTHEFVTRIVASLADEAGGGPVRILTTDSEFHSFERQVRRWAEAGSVQLTRVATEPFDSFEDRFLAEASRAEHDLVYVSQVFFNSSFVFQRFRELAEAVPEPCSIVVDGYHGFLALPTDLGPCEDRLFYLAGGYKYAMSGEGVCFLHAPDGYLERPIDTGWYATFGEIAAKAGGDRVGYGEGGWRFWGATFDPAGLYRMDAVLGWLEELELTPERIHAHVGGLQERFLAEAKGAGLPGFDVATLTPDPSFAQRGHFLNFRSPQAGELHAALRRAGVLTDYRGDNLRLGFGLYQDPSDVDELCARIRGLGAD